MLAFRSYVFLAVTYWKVNILLWKKSSTKWVFTVGSGVGDGFKWVWMRTAYTKSHFYFPKSLYIQMSLIKGTIIDIFTWCVNNLCCEIVCFWKSWLHHNKIKSSVLWTTFFVWYYWYITSPKLRMPPSSQYHWHLELIYGWHWESAGNGLQSEYMITSLVFVIPSLKWQICHH